MLRQHLEGAGCYFGRLYKTNVGDGEGLEMMQLTLPREPTLTQGEMETTLILFCVTFLVLLMRQTLLDNYCQMMT